MSVINTNDYGVRYATVLTDDIGADVPVWDPEGLYKEWHYDEIYFGKDKIGEGKKGRFVPNVDNKVWAADRGTYYVKELNPTTLIPVLQRYVEPEVGGADTKDWLLGVGDRWPQQGFFMYADNEQDVPRISLDAQAIFRHPAISFFRCYGYDASGNLEVISAWFNQSGEYKDDKIPRLEVDSTQSPDGYQYYVPEVFWGTRKFIERETVKLVGFSAENNEIAEASFIVRTGSTVRRSSTPARRIASIELRSAYLSTTEENRLRIPTGTNIASVAMMCRVNFESGKFIDLPIDGTKVRIQGLEESISTSPGWLRDIILYYYMGEGEMYVGSDSNDGKSIRQVYKVEVDPTQETYGFKLFMYPTWIDANNGWGWVSFLHDYDHSQVYDVSGMVEQTANSGIWDPFLLGVKQYLRVAIDVNKVDPRYNEYRHAQTIQMALIEKGGTDADNYWRVYYEDGQSPAYGDGCKAVLTYVSSQVWTGDLSCGCASVEEWLDKLYYRTLPLFDPTTEKSPLEPTHFVYTLRGQRYRHPITDWNKTIQVKTGGQEAETSVIHFISSQNGVDLYLGTSGLYTHQVIS